MKKLNWPNRLSILRLALAFVVIVLVITSYYGEVRGQNHWSIQSGKYELSYLMLTAGIVFILASVTDFLDGYLARKHNQITVLGQFLDPIADKILVNSVLVMFDVYGILPIWMTVILIVRDTLVDFLRMTLASHQITLSAGIYGKLKTVFQMIGLTILFFFSYINFRAADPNVLGNEYSYLNQILMIPMYVATFFSIFSCAIYFKDGAKNLKTESNTKNGTVQ